VSTATYDEEAEFLLDSYDTQPCEDCAGGRDDHYIAPDANGHAHACCKSEES
jgi:hypothetical protein